MANPLPTLRGSSQQVLYPFTRSIICPTLVKIWPNASEQRNASSTPLTELVLPMNRLSATDKASWLTFLNTVKGMQATDIEVTIGSTTYSNLTLTEDVITAVTKQPRQYDQSIHLRQTKRYPYTPPSAGNTYPTFSFGTNSQMPFSQMTRFKTSINDSPFGPRYSWSWFGAGLTNFPTGALMAWKIVYALLTDADVVTLENFFLNKHGKYKSFTFVDPISGTSYDHVRFDMDKLDIRYDTVNNNSAEVLLLQTYLS